uniref:Exosortase/archaeosortase family protein n=1 Tax=Hydrogenovibrio crunogenus (strain DSM 25203 / XCL-2) TaxID=317025 RepID=Q31GH9_HYDCU
MFGFIVRYVFWVCLLFWMVFFDQFSPIFIINQLQTDLMISLTWLWVDALELSLRIQDNTLILSNGMSLRIVHECNGLTPFLLFLAAVLAYPTFWKNKVAWAIFGYIALLVINVVRMLLITLVVIDYPDLFHFAHDWVGRYSVGLLTLGLFFLFTVFVPIQATSLKDRHN